MKNRIVILTFLFAGFILLSGCGNSELKKDTRGLSDAMCRIIDVMNKLKAVNPADSEQVTLLQMQAKNLQIEMTILNKEFQEKYKNKLSDEKFKKDYSKYFREAMLTCPHLSKEDRERFQKEVE